jgi:bifunctional non-homologous end joining protein LigD
MTPVHVKKDVTPKLLAGLPSGIRTRAQKSPQPGWVPPMLATLTDERFSRSGWLFEPKLDGERCLVFCHDGNIRLMSRNHKLLNDKYPELVRAFERQNAAPFILDGEIVAFQGSITSFAKLQQRMQVSRPSAELRREIPVWFYAFDVPYLSGFDTRQLPLRYRKQVLQAAFEFTDPLRFNQHRDTEGEAYYEEACREGLEGIIAKNGESEYISGRSRQWLKFKCINEQEFVIGGYTDPQGSRLAFGAVLIGYYRQGKLLYAGKVGTGYDTATLNSLGNQLSAIKADTCPFDGGDIESRGAHWVKPRLVAQIGFTEWTADGKLRHPRFVGLRDDKAPQDVVREK